MPVVRPSAGDAIPLRRRRAEKSTSGLPPIRSEARARRHFRDLGVKRPSDAGLGAEFPHGGGHLDDVTERKPPPCESRCDECESLRSYED